MIATIKQNKNILQQLIHNVSIYLGSNDMWAITNYREVLNIIIIKTICYNQVQLCHSLIFVFVIVTANMLWLSNLSITTIY